MTLPQPALLRHLHRCAALLAITLTTALQAQTILGTWQATLPTGDDPRIVLKFARAVVPLGLKLVRKKEPLTVIVIDHAEKPSAN